MNYNNPTLYYRHSGKVPLASPLIVFCIGALGAAVLSGAYGYAMRYIPLVYFNFLITIGFGAIMAIILTMAGKGAKIRNDRFMMIIGLLIGLLARYLSLIVWIFAFSEQKYLVFSPAKVFSVLQYAASTGLWSIRGWTPKTFLWVIWAVESLIIVGIPFLASGSLEPFCEICGKWVTGTYEITHLQNVQNFDEIKSHMEKGDFSRLLELKPATPPLVVFLNIILSFCEGCNDNCYLSIVKTVISKDKKGKEKRDTTDLVKNLIIRKETLVTIKEHYQQPPVTTGE